MTEPTDLWRCNECMDGRLDREALDPYIERAEDLLEESLEEIVR